MSRAAAWGGEELDPGLRDGVQGPADRVNMVLVRQLGRSSQTMYKDRQDL